jgi:hypothetical protein
MSRERFNISLAKANWRIPWLLSPPLTRVTVNIPPVAGMSATSPRVVEKVDRSSCANCRCDQRQIQLFKSLDRSHGRHTYAARSIHRHCVQKTMATRGMESEVCDVMAEERSTMESEVEMGWTKVPFDVLHDDAVVPPLVSTTAKLVSIVYQSVRNSPHRQCILRQPCMHLLRVHLRMSAFSVYPLCLF